MLQIKKKMVLVICWLMYIFFVVSLMIADTQYGTFRVNAIKCMMWSLFILVIITYVYFVYLMINSKNKYKLWIIHISAVIVSIGIYFSVVLGVIFTGYSEEIKIINGEKYVVYTNLRADKVMQKYQNFFFMDEEILDYREYENKSKK